MYFCIPPSKDRDSFYPVFPMAVISVVTIPTGLVHSKAWSSALWSSRGLSPSSCTEITSHQQSTIYFQPAPSSTT